MHPLAHEVIREEFLLKDRPGDPHSSCREAACNKRITTVYLHGIAAGFKDASHIAGSLGVSCALWTLTGISKNML